MSSSQEKEQEGHYFLPELASVKPGDAGKETREDFQKRPLRCACVSACASMLGKQLLLKETVQPPYAPVNDSDSLQTKNDMEAKKGK